MRKEKFIKKLIVATVTVLLCIVGLQIYWLVASYHEEKSRFKANIEDALSSTNIKTTLRKALGVKNNELLDAIDTKSLIEKAETLDKEYKNNREEGKQNLLLLMDNPSIRITDTQKMLSLLKKMIDSNRIFKMGSQVSTTIRFEITDSDMQDYTKSFQKELLLRNVSTPFELAVVDSANHIYMASGDSAIFKAAPLKTSLSELTGTNGKIGLQAAFPNAGGYLIRKMLWISLLTMALIFFGAFLLSYLLHHLFRQNKIAVLRNDFMNNMAHELKTPISSVSVALELALDESRQMTEEKRRSYFLIAQRELNRLNVLVESVLKILSLEKTEIEINPDTIQVTPWLAGIIERLQPLLDERNAEVDVSVKPLTLDIKGDKTHITNVMHNIIENALKYNDKEKPLIQIDIYSERPMTHIKISDNGEGIPPKYLHKIFDKFFRVPKGDNHDVKGYGLGLTYVKGIIDRHNGRISVNSVLKEGTEFTISLPE